MAIANTALNYSSELAHRLYDQKIRQQIAVADRSKYLMIDLTSGDFEVDADDIRAEERLLERHPDAELYLLRADGGPAGYLGGSWH